MAQYDSLLERDQTKNAGTGCDIYGRDRLRVGLVVSEILNALELPWYIEFGTLLGAFRNHQFIAHDDDFDIALLLRTSDLVQTIRDVHQQITERLPAPLGCRVVDTYTDKIEVYDPTFGKFTLLHPIYNGADFHYVTVDLQTCIIDDDNSVIRSTYRGKPFELVWDMELVFPLRTIELEGKSFPCPNQPRRFLETAYGCIDDGAVYDEETGLYKPGP